MNQKFLHKMVVLYSWNLLVLIASAQSAITYQGTIIKTLNENYINKSLTEDTNKSMSSSHSEPFFKNQLGYKQYCEPMLHLNFHRKVVSDFESMLDLEEEHSVKYGKDDSETQDESKPVYVAVILFKYLHFYQPIMKMNLILKATKVRTGAHHE